MKPISAEDFARIVGGRAVGVPPGVAIYGFALDSREARPGALFVAIQGAREDGHDYVAAAFANGAAVALTTRGVEGPHIEVESVEAALARLGAHFRGAFTGPVVAVTGSAGKTTTKEFLAAALSPLGAVLKTRGNRNSEYSAPLMWAELDTGHRAVVVEMAMRGFGQIGHLCSFSRPNIGLITNIGSAHLEQVGSREGVAQAKGELLEALPVEGVSVLWHEDEFLDALRKRAPGEVATFGFGEGATCRITDYQALAPERCFVQGTLEGVRFACELPTVGRHQALNAAAALMGAHAAGVPVFRAVEGIPKAVLPAMRMEPLIMRGAVVLLDAYNASPAGMRAAIETLADLPCEGRRLAVVGEMKELGQAGPFEHREIGLALARAGVEGALFVGEGTGPALESFLESGGAGAKAESLEDVTEFLETLKEGDLVLVKGSRALELERALEPLREDGP